MKKWEIKFKIKNSKLKIQNFNIDNVISVLLKNRNLVEQKDIEEFLNPKIENVNAESVGIDLKQLEKTIKRIKKAIKEGEQIVIYGDYDVDGITASAILWETLYGIGAKVKPYIPDRVDEGYGLSIAGISNACLASPRQQAGNKRVKLIITVDNGIVANEAVDYANEQGIDVIITDHHTFGEIVPKAYSIIHTTKLCGAGIAYLLSQEIMNVCHAELVSASLPSQKGIPKQVQHDNLDEEDKLLELAALGTVADLVPLIGPNRAIVKFGLQKLCNTKRHGLYELYREAGCDKDKIGVYEVGYIIAPRLNATGRMASAMDSLRLLCTKDRNRAAELAGILGVTNRERQAVMREAAEHAIEKIKASADKQEIKNILVSVHESYPEGVIGLVAGRIVEEFYRPSIVISRSEKYSKGSVRSIRGFNIVEFLRQSSDFFVNIGGHPMAAGFTIETEKIEKMQEALEKLAHNIIDDDLLVRTLKIDCELPLSIITDKLYQSIQKLAPFGMGNPEPTFASKNVTVEKIRIMGKDGKHLRLTVSQLGAEFDAVAFGMGNLAEKLHIGDKIDLAYTVQENNWNGSRKLELRVKDIIVGS